MFVLNRCLLVKVTVGITSSDPLFLEWCVRFTTVPFKPWSDQWCLILIYQKHNSLNHTPKFTLL